MPPRDVEFTSNVSIIACCPAYNSSKCFLEMSARPGPMAGGGTEAQAGPSATTSGASSVERDFAGACFTIFTEWVATNFSAFLTVASAPELAQPLNQAGIEIAALSNSIR